jgi:hypothetical protein
MVCPTQDVLRSWLRASRPVVEPPPSPALPQPTVARCRRDDLSLHADHRDADAQGPDQERELAREGDQPVSGVEPRGVGACIDRGSGHEIANGTDVGQPAYPPGQRCRVQNGRTLPRP